MAFEDAGRAHQAVDFGRWIFDWIENDPPRVKVRNTNLAKRYTSCYRPMFPFSIGHDGVEVHLREFPE